MLVATLVPVWRALAYCLVVLAANLTAHLVAGDLSETPAVAVIGLWVGYPFWSAIFAVTTDRLAAYILRLNAARARERRAPVRVVSWSTSPLHTSPPDEPGSIERERSHGWDRTPPKHRGRRRSRERPG